MTTETTETVKCPQCGEEISRDLRHAYDVLYGGYRSSLDWLEPQLRRFMPTGALAVESAEEAAAVMALEVVLGLGELADLTRAVRHRMAEGEA